QTLNNSGNYVANLLSVSGCDSVVNLNLTVIDTLRSLSSSSICSNQLPFSWNGQNLNSTGTYHVNLVSASGCDSVATLNFNVRQISTNNISESICSADLPYVWNGQSL